MKTAIQDIFASPKLSDSCLYHRIFGKTLCYRSLEHSSPVFERILNTSLSVQLVQIKKLPKGSLLMVRPRRFERLTSSFAGRRSIQLSYGRIIQFKIQRAKCKMFVAFGVYHYIKHPKGIPSFCFLNFALCFIS